MINRSLGQLRVRLGLDDKQFKGSLKDNRAELRVFARTAATVGVAGVVALGSAMAVLTRRSLAEIDAQAKLAQSLDTTVGSMQVLTRAGELAGVEMAGIEQLSKDMTRRLSQAADSGAGPAAEALTRLGLSAQDLMALPLDQRIAQINDAIDKFIPAAGRAAVAGQLFGEEGSIAASRLDSSVIRTATAELERFGVIVSDIDAEKIEQANDSMSRLGLASKGLGNELAVRFAPGLTMAADGLTRLLTGQSSLEMAIDNTTIGMGDQVRQTAQLNAALGQGTVMTRQAAEEQLRLAEARRADYEVAMLQVRAAVESSAEYQALTTQARQLSEVYFEGLREIQENPLTASYSAEELEAFRAELERIGQVQTDMLSGSSDLSDSYAQNEENVRRIRAAIAAARGNMVSFNGEVVEGITLSDRLVVNLEGSAVSADEVRAAVAGIDFSNPLAGAQALSRQLGVSLSQAMQIMGLVGGAAQARNDPVIFDPRDQRFDPEQAERAARLERIRANMEDLQKEAAAAAENVEIFEAAVGGSPTGGGVGGAAGAVQDLEDSLTPAEEAAKTFGETMRTKVTGGVESMVDYIVSDGEKSLKGLADIFRRVVLDMVATAAKNRILLRFGLIGAPSAGAAQSASGLGAVATQGAGGLAGLGGAGGGILGGLGTGLFSAAPTYGTGLLGGMGATLGQTFGAGGGLGGLLSVGSNAALAGGGLAATLGAAIPVIGVVAGLFSLFKRKRKPIISGEDFQAVQVGLELTGQSLLGTGTAGQLAAKSLRDAAGGMDEFTSKTQTYFDAFFTSEEKLKIATDALGSVFDGLGIKMPETNAEFRQIVEGLDLTTAAGRNAYSELISVAGAFSDVYGTAQSAADALATVGLTLADVSAPFGGSAFQSRAEEMLANGVLARGGQVSFVQRAGGVLRPDESVLFSETPGAWSDKDQATVMFSVANHLAAISRKIDVWDALGVPTAVEATT